ncbi:sensor histidine kinase [Streptomyces sp. NPDC059851]|uniref:sensor histidine kinase n=1 Tax=Streptomyces sp. NPDC059851 TaxID=3346971 RepID=UPI003661DCAF
MGVQRARRWGVKGTGLFRAAHLFYAGSVVITEPYDIRAIAILVAVGLTSVVLYASALRRGWFAPHLVWADVLVTGCVLPWIAVAVISEGPAVEPHGWLLVQALSAGTAAVVGLGWRGAVVSVALLLMTSMAVHQAVPESEWTVVLEHMSAVLVSVGFAAAGWWYLRREGSMLDAAQERAVAAETALARQAERTIHHAALHDTVLATLTTIAGGQVDANAASVRDRCAREAAYLRRLIQLADAPHHDSGRVHRCGPLGEGAANTGAALEEAVRSAEGLGLTVFAQYHAVPDLPGEVAESLAAAVSEAFNNVRRHAGTDVAYLTIVGSSAGVEVTVADRGIGFDTSRADHRETGTGLRRSIQGRLATVGGSARVDSQPGEGTVVELRWPT